MVHCFWSEEQLFGDRKSAGYRVTAPVCTISVWGHRLNQFDVDFQPGPRCTSISRTCDFLTGLEYRCVTSPGLPLGSVSLRNTFLVLEDPILCDELFVGFSLPTGNWR